MRTQSLKAPAFLLLLGAFAAACGTSAGSNPGSSTFPEEGDAASADPGTPPSFPDASSSLQPTFDTACATSRSQAEPRPAFLVIMLDRSGSMNNNEKWKKVSSGLTSFFSDTRTLGLYASLGLFPAADGDMCTADYKTPKVPLRPLPESPEETGAFRDVIGAVTPGGRTPTVPALKGALEYAADVHAKYGEAGKVAVVFVTDGNPDGCDGNDIGSAGAAATAAAAKTPTYVIGIGSSLQSLNYIAKRGGTGQAILVSDDPSQTVSQLVYAMDRITRESVACEYTIPAPKDGTILDPFNVNVVATHEGGSEELIPYNSTCSGKGWHYDNKDRPTQVLMCPDTCTGLVDDRRIRVDLLFGCATQGDLK